MLDYSPYVRKLKEASDRALPRLADDFTGIANAFDPQPEKDWRFVPDGLVPMARLPLWDELTEKQRRLLNRLTWCHYYHKITLLELTVNDLSTATAFRCLGNAQTDVAHYVSREVAEETVHIEAFSRIARDELERSGVDVAGFYAAHRAAARRYRRYMAIIRRSMGALRHPGLYYLTRYTLNIAGRAYEGEIARCEEVHPQIRAIVQNHMNDESRHLTMSRMTGHQCFKDTRTLRALGLATTWLAFVLLVPPETHFDGPEHDWFDYALSQVGLGAGARRRAIRGIPAAVGRSPQLVGIRDCFLKENLAVLGAAPIPAGVRALYARLLTRRLSMATPAGSA